MGTAGAYGQTFASLFPNGFSPSEQGTAQVLALLVTLGMALVGGVFTAKVVNFITKLLPKVEDHRLAAFDDELAWEVAHDFDKC